MQNAAGARPLKGLPPTACYWASVSLIHLHCVAATFLALILRYLVKLPNPCEPGCYAISNCNYDLLADSDLENLSLENHPLGPNLRRFALIQPVAFPDIYIRAYIYSIYIYSMIDIYSIYVYTVYIYIYSEYIRNVHIYNKYSKEHLWCFTADAATQVHCIQDIKVSRQRAHSEQIVFNYSMIFIKV